MPAGASSPAEPVLSVVLACDGALDRLADRLDAIARSCQGVPAEVFVVHPTGVHVPDFGAPTIPTTRLTAESDLVPVLWGRGMASSRGRIVALTTTQFRVGDQWARALLAAIEDNGLVAVGGRMALGTTAGTLERAVFLLRYADHMGEGTEAPREIAGDNAAYVREAVAAVMPDLAPGFWEVDVHRLMRAAGGRMGRAPAAVAVFDPALSMRAMLVNRFVHGSHYGAYRVRVLHWPRWKAVSVTPLVPAVLFARMLQRLRRAGQRARSAAPLVPALVLLLCAWAAGEAYGAISNASDTRA